jgi:hypothetical protein
MSDGLIIVSTVSALFLLGVFSLIMDSIYSRSDEVVYVKRKTKPIKIEKVIEYDILEE